MKRFIKRLGIFLIMMFICIVSLIVFTCYRIKTADYIIKRSIYGNWIVIGYDYYIVRNEKAERVPKSLLAIFYEPLEFDNIFNDDKLSKIFDVDLILSENHADYKNQSGYYKLDMGEQYFVCVRQDNRNTVLKKLSMEDIQNINHITRQLNEYGDVLGNSEEVLFSFKYIENNGCVLVLFQRESIREANNAFCDVIYEYKEEKLKPINGIVSHKSSMGGSIEYVFFPHRQNN